MKILFIATLLLAVYISSGASESSENALESFAAQGSLNAANNRVVRDAANKKKNKASKKKNRSSKKKNKASKKKNKSSKKKNRSSKKKNKAFKKKNRSSKKKNRASKKKNKSSKKKNRTSKKKNKASKKKNRSSKKKNKSSKKKNKSSKNKSDLKQTTTDTCFADLVAKTKKFKLYTNEYRKVARIENWADLSQNKKVKAASTFNPVISTMSSQTGGGSACSNATAQISAVANYDLLKDCATTAAALCDVALSTEQKNQTDTCKPLLKEYTDGFDACLKSGDCACFQALKVLDSTCESFSTLNDDIKGKKNKCIKGDEKGSFGACRAAEREAAVVGPQCGCNCPTTTSTTSAPASGRNMRRDMLFRNFRNLNL